MKQFNFFINELTVAEVLELSPTSQLLVYNPHSQMYHFEFADKNCSVHNKFKVTSLRYFLFTIGDLPKR